MWLKTIGRSGAPDYLYIGAEEAAGIYAEDFRLSRKLSEKWRYLSSLFDLLLHHQLGTIRNAETLTGDVSSATPGTGPSRGIRPVL
jgi:hypothetical protein